MSEQTRKGSPLLYLRLPLHRLLLFDLVTHAIDCGFLCGASLFTLSSFCSDSASSLFATSFATLSTFSKPTSKRIGSDCCYNLQVADEKNLVMLVKIWQSLFQKRGVDVIILLTSTPLLWKIVLRSSVMNPLLLQHNYSGY